MIDEPAEDGPEYTAEDLERIGRTWSDKLLQAEKRDEKWHKLAERAEAAYSADAGEYGTDGVLEFNILHSNVETIVPSIFNSTPIPEIRPRHGANDPAAKQVSDIYERAISTLIDDSRLDAEVEFQAQDAFMAGRGVVRLKFDADEQEQPPIVYLDPMTGEEYEEPQEPLITNERIIYEVVSWRDYREGPANRWSNVPWVAFRHEISEQERERLEDESLTKEYQEENDGADENKDCVVWEIWCKETAKVYFLIEESSKIISMIDDPIGLTGFFPMAQPIQPSTLTGKRTPICPYAVYEKLAEELDIATKRINKITKGLKVRGGAAIGAEAIEQMMQAGDNEIAVLADIEGLGAMGGIEKAIMWWPIDQAVKVLQQLYAQREQTKQAIYEITGISDIIRGQGQASETATAQQIKTEWGALRIKKMQRMIERQVRDIFVLSAEIMSQHFSPQTLGKMSGIEITPEVAQLLNQPLDHYRIDVETNSTVRANQTRNREEMAGFLKGTAEFFSTMAPIVAQAPQTAGPLARMYGAFAAQFSLGKSAEDALDQFVQMAEQASQEPAPNPQAEAMKAEQEMRGQEMQMKMQELQGKMQLEVEKLKLQAQNLGLDAEIKKVELALKKQELDLKADSLTLDERQAEFNAVKDAVEIEMEQTQERPVAVGN